MLVQNAYSVFDLKAETFSLPMFAITDEVAKRLFADVVAYREGSIGAHPEDYVLFRVGVFNSDTGAMAGTDGPISVWSGIEAMKSHSQERK